MNLQEKCFTRVIFRAWKDSKSIVAIVLDVEANPGRVVCYEHVGQHGEGTYHGIVDDSTPATPEQYDRLKEEMQGLGYRFTHVYRRRPKDWKQW